MTEETSGFKVHLLKIDDLEVDENNIRKGLKDEWNHDRERDKNFIEDIRNRGIKSPLLVRPNNSGTGKKYKIVNGSRRYNAAKEIGLKCVPCIIEEMSDAEAMSFSMNENLQRSDTPVWRNIEFAGKIYNHNENLLLSHEKRLEKISGSPATAVRYVRLYELYELHEVFKILMMNPDERTSRQMEYLLRYNSRNIYRKLKLEHADMLWELKSIVSLEKLIEVGLFIISFKEEFARKFVDLIKMNPEEPLQDLYYKKMKKIYGVFKPFDLDAMTNNWLVNACMAEQRSYKEIIIEALRDWLKRNGYSNVEFVKIKEQKDLTNFGEDALNSEIASSNHDNEGLGDGVGSYSRI